SSSGRTHGYASPSGALRSGGARDSRGSPRCRETTRRDCARVARHGRLSRAAGFDALDPSREEKGERSQKRSWIGSASSSPKSGNRAQKIVPGTNYAKKRAWHELEGKIVPGTDFSKKRAWHHFLEQQALGDPEVDALEADEVVDRDGLVDLVDRLVQWAELDDGDAVRGDEAAVGRGAARRQLGPHAGLVLGGFADGFSQRAGRRQERLAGDAPPDRVVDAEPIELRLDARGERRRRPLRRVAEVETAVELAGDD